MLKIEGEDKIQITEGLKAAGIGSVEQVREKLLASVSQNEGYSAERASLFEVILRVSKDNGYTWGYVSAANFPESGEVRVTLPYPQGAPKDTPKENYRVYHMFTEDINGHKAGEIEECPVEKINEGLVVTLHGLSPVMIAWTPVDETAKPTAEPTSAPTAAPSAEPTDAPDTQPEATAEPTAAPSEKPVVDAPKTGDSGVHFLWIAAVLLSGSVITALAFVKRKKQ
ncbi:MAG: PT domain-containing protein [Acutalibacteraceae bacterium]